MEKSSSPEIIPVAKRENEHVDNLASSQVDTCPAASRKNPDTLEDVITEKTIDTTQDVREDKRDDISPEKSPELQLKIEPDDVNAARSENICHGDDRLDKPAYSNETVSLSTVKFHREIAVSGHETEIPAKEKVKSNGEIQVKLEPVLSTTIDGCDSSKEIRKPSRFLRQKAKIQRSKSMTASRHPEDDPGTPTFEYKGKLNDCRSEIDAIREQHKQAILNSHKSTQIGSSNVASSIGIGSRRTLSQNRLDKLQDFAASGSLSGFGSRRMQPSQSFRSFERRASCGPDVARLTFSMPYQK